jgi:hypothetical protein
MGNLRDDFKIEDGEEERIFLMTAQDGTVLFLSIPN